MKFCKDCLYIRYPLTGDVPTCSAPTSNTKVDLVSGVKFYNTCYNMRASPLCDVEALSFQAKDDKDDQEEW